MAWIESHQSLKEHPKLTELANKLKIPKVQAIGHLHVLWWWCIDYAPNGQLDRWSPTQIASAAWWEGNPGELIQSLADAGFLDRDPLRIHDWIDFCGDLIKKRLEYKERKHIRSGRFLGDSQRNSPTDGELSQHTNQPTVPTKPTVTNQPNQPTARAHEALRLVERFKARLEAKHGEKINSFHEKALCAFLEQTLDTPVTGEEISRRVMNWFGSSDQFIIDNGYSETLFMKKFHLLKGGPLHARKNPSSGNHPGVKAAPDKYAKITENR